MKNHSPFFHGNFDYVVNWENDGAEIRNCDGCRLNAMGTDELFFKEGITWSHTTSSVFGARYLPEGCLFNVEAPTLFAAKDPFYKDLAEQFVLWHQKNHHRFGAGFFKNKTAIEWIDDFLLSYFPPKYPESTIQNCIFIDDGMAECCHFALDRM